MTTNEIVEKLRLIERMKNDVDPVTGEFNFTDEEIAIVEAEINATKEEKLNAIQDYKISLNNEIARFKEKKAVQDANIKRTEKFQDYLKELQISLLDGEKLKTDEFNFYFTNSVKVDLIDIDSIQDKYCKFEKRIIAKDVKEAMLQAEKNGESFLGANLVRSKSLVVR